MEEKLLRIKDVKAYIPLSTASIYAKMSQGKFPKVHKIGGTAFWKMSEIQEYITQGDNYVQKTA